MLAITRRVNVRSGWKADRKLVSLPQMDGYRDDDPTKLTVLEIAKANSILALLLFASVIGAWALGLIEL